VLDAEWRRVKAGIGGDLVRSLAFAVCIAVARWEITGQQQSIGIWVVVTTGLKWMSGFARSLARIARSTREQVAYAGDLFAVEEESARFIAASAPVILKVATNVDRHSERSDESPGKAGILPERAITTVTHKGMTLQPGGSLDRPYTARGNFAPLRMTAHDPHRGMAIEVQGASFAYPGNPRQVIENVSFRIEPGETIAIVGENGAGKSTLIRLLTGLYLPDTGRVLLDGIDTRQGAPQERTRN
jgi:ABC-type multidrug transport system fused ATPase/permease subunit